MPDMHPELSPESTLPSFRWGWLLAYGLLLILTGIVAVTNPLATGIVTGLLIGFTIAFYGILAIVAGLSAMSGHARWTELVLGVFALVAGGLVIMMPLAGSATLIWMLGFWLLAAGIAEIISAFRISMDRGWRLFLGIIHIILGLLLVFMDLRGNLVLLAMLISVSFLARGIFVVWFAMAARRVTNTLS